MASKSPDVPILGFPNSAIVLDTIVLERTSNKLGNYRVKEPGAPFDKATHSKAQMEEFGDCIFLDQQQTDDDEWTLRRWGREPATQDVANWDRSLSGESNSHPIFLRRYLERRDTYAPRAKASALPGLYRIEVSNPGSGYINPPTISFTGGTGSGASAVAVLNNSGGVARIVIKSEGTYSVAPAVTITTIGGGSGAVAVARVQDAACVLVEERTTDNAPEPYRSLYIVATRLYETLPGPWIPFARFDRFLGWVQGQRRAVLNTGQVPPTPTFTTKQWYEGREGSSIVLIEIVETNSDGSGTAGNPLFPILTDETTDRKTGAVDRKTKTVKLKSAITEGIELIDIGGFPFIVITDSEAITDTQSIETVETQTLPEARDSGSQIETAEESKAFQFPATLDVIKYGSTNGLVGYTKTFVRRVPHVTKSYWVFSETKPVLVLNGVTVLATIDNLFVGVLTNEPLSELIVNGGEFTYGGTIMTIHASNPSLTEYTAAAPPDGWLSGPPRAVSGSVQQDGNPFRWRVDRVYVLFLRPIIPTYS